MGKADADAARLLEALWPGGPEIPVDPVWIAQALGIKVYTAPMDGDISGVLTKKRADDAMIYLNVGHHKNRQRFTCAHELGHWWSRTSADDFDFEFIDRRDSLAAAGTDSDEIYANQFAAALLMPADAVRRLHRQEVGLQETALRFGVSVEAMSHRLHNLGLR